MLPFRHLAFYEVWSWRNFSLNIHRIFLYISRRNRLLFVVWTRITCEAVGPSLACQSHGVKTVSRGVSLAVLCVISIVAVLLFFSAEERWQPPLRWTRPVSQYLVFCWRRKWMLTNVRQNFAKEAGFCLDCCWRGLKRRQAAEAWLQHPCPFPHWAAVHNTAILYSFAANLYARMLRRIVVVKALYIMPLS